MFYLKTNRTIKPTNVKRLLFLVCFLLATPLLWAATKELQMLKPMDVKPIKSSQGYMLIYVDIPRETTIQFTKISTSFKADARQRSKSKKALQSKTIRLKENDKGFYLLPLNKGLYQITKVEVPYFNLPFRQVIKNRVDWRFFIDARKTNYIGHLVIAEERTKSYLDINLYNRIAKNSSEFDDSIKAHTDIYPLVSGSGFVDDFYQDYSKVLVNDDGKGE